MYYSKYDLDDLYEIALHLFQQAGFTYEDEPISSNNTAEQFILFNLSPDIILTGNEWNILKKINDISELFRLEDDYFKSGRGTIAFYSIDLDCDLSERSQVSYDTHMLIQSASTDNASVIVFRHEDKIMFSMAAERKTAILSDWYEIRDGLEELSGKIDICNMSCETWQSFISSLIYSCARWYYVYHIEKSKRKLPKDYFYSTRLGEIISWDYVAEDRAAEYARLPEIEYGDDYVEDNDQLIRRKEISDEIENIALNLELNSLDESKETKTSDNNKATSQDSELADIPQWVFDDPVAMEKWLKTH